MATKTMGVVDVTPDSFVGEIRTPEVDQALRRCRRLVEEGAEFLDIGGESTRPGAAPITVEEELRRVVPVIESITPELPNHVQVSIDTRHELVARSAVAAGAVVINDTSASLGPLAGELGVGFVAIHGRARPSTVPTGAGDDRMVEGVIESVVASALAAVEAGAGPVWIDPGIGLGTTNRQDLELLGCVDRLVRTGVPVLIGVSRKGTTGRIHAASDQGLTMSGLDLATLDPTPTDDRLEASLALATWCALLGVDVVRVHDVAPTVQAMKVVDARSPAQNR